MSFHLQLEVIPWRALTYSAYTLLRSSRHIDTSRYTISCVDLHMANELCRLVILVGLIERLPP